MKASAMGGFLTRRYSDCNYCDYSKSKVPSLLSLHQSNATLLYLNVLSSSSYCSRTSIDHACHRCLGNSTVVIHRRRHVWLYWYDLHRAIIEFSGIGDPQMNRVLHLNLRHQVCSNTQLLVRLVFESDSYVVDLVRGSKQQLPLLSFLSVHYYYYYYCYCFLSDYGDGSSADAMIVTDTIAMTAIVCFSRA